MTWKNDDLVLYHGTDESAAQAILSKGVDLKMCSQFTDFGSGFYTTTHLDQAKNWASNRAIRIRARIPSARGAVIEMRVNRDWISDLQALVFVRPARETGWEAFVRHCRNGLIPHKTSGNYDIVYGPVAQWQNLAPSFKIFVIADCDQVSFHNSVTTSHSSQLFAASSIIWTEL